MPDKEAAEFSDMYEYDPGSELSVDWKLRGLEKSDVEVVEDEFWEKNDCSVIAGDAVGLQLRWSLSVFAKSLLFNEKMLSELKLDELLQNKNYLVVVINDIKFDCN